MASVTHGEPTPCNYYMHDLDTANGAFWESERLKNCETRYSDILVHFIFGACKNSLRFFWVNSLDAVHWQGTAILALIHLLAHLVTVSGSLMLVAGFLEATWRWNLKPGSSPLEPAVYLLNFAMLAVHRFGPHPVRMLLQGGRWCGSDQSVFVVLPFRFPRFLLFLSRIFFRRWV